MNATRKKPISFPPKNILVWTSPIGLLEITLSPEKVQSINLVSKSDIVDTTALETPLGHQVKKQLQDYFQNERRSFDLPLDWNQGTAFQQKVWQALTKIPYAQTWSYADIAQAIGQPKALRAVGQAIGKNPWLIVVPCHRVISSNGKIGGFSSGIAAKRQLLTLELGVKKFESQKL